LKIFVLSFVIGVGMGVLCALTFKILDLRHHPSHKFMESALTMVFPWSAYFLAEAFELSGIVAILFAGITMAYYAMANMSNETQEITKAMYKVAATIAETFVFVYLGMSVFAFQAASSSLLLFQDNAHFRLIIVAIVAVLIARLFNIFPMSWLVNLFRGPHTNPPTISGKFQFIMWFSGLRGGVAYAIAVANYSDNEFPENDNSLAILQTTLFVAVFTIFVFGGAITRIAMYFDVIDRPSEDDDGVELQPRTSTASDASGMKTGAFSKVDRVVRPLLTLKPTQPHEAVPEEPQA